MATTPSDDLFPDREHRLREALLCYLRAVDAGQAPDPAELVARFPDVGEEMLLRVALALYLLPEDLRGVLVARDLLGTPVPQVAARMRRSEKVVAELLARGRRRLRALLVEQTGGDHGD